MGFSVGLSSFRFAISISASVHKAVVGFGFLAALALTAQAAAPKLRLIRVLPASVVGGTVASATVTLTAPALAGGYTFSLADTDAAVREPATGTVPAGASSVVVSIPTSAVALDHVTTLSASAESKTVSAVLTVLAPKVKLTVNPTSFVAGTSAKGTVTLTGPAPTGGMTISLSSNSGVVKIPASVKVAARAMTAAFTIATIATWSGPATVTATLNRNSYPANIVVLASSGLAKSAWPKAKGNLAGTAASKAVSASGVLKWKTKLTTGEVISAPIIGADGTLYVSAEDSRLYAIGRTGRFKWSFKTDGPSGSIPAISADGTVYFGSNDNKLWAVGPDGKAKWSFATGLNNLSAPTILGDGTIIFGSADGSLYALDSAGKKRWEFSEPSNLYSSPAVAPDGTIYVGSEDNNLYAITVTGVKKWKVNLGHVVRSSPTVGPDGTIYVGCWNGWFYAINPADGGVKWQFQTQGIAFQSPALSSDGVVYIADANKTLIALDAATGAKKWAFTMGGIGDTPAIAGDGTIYIGSEDGNVYAVKPDGTLKWKFLTAGFPSSPAIGADGVVYVGSGAGFLYAIR